MENPESMVKRMLEERYPDLARQVEEAQARSSRIKPQRVNLRGATDSAKQPFGRSETRDVSSSVPFGADSRSPSVVSEGKAHDVHSVNESEPPAIKMANEMQIDDYAAQIRPEALQSARPIAKPSDDAMAKNVLAEFDGTQMHLYTPETMATSENNEVSDSKPLAVTDLTHAHSASEKANNKGLVRRHSANNRDSGVFNSGIQDTPRSKEYRSSLRAGGSQIPVYGTPRSSFSQSDAAQLDAISGVERAGKTVTENSRSGRNEESVGSQTRREDDPGNAAASTNPLSVGKLTASDEQLSVAVAFSAERSYDVNSSNRTPYADQVVDRSKLVEQQVHGEHMRKAPSQSPNRILPPIAFVNNHVDSRAVHHSTALTDSSFLSGAEHVEALPLAADMGDIHNEKGVSNDPQRKPNGFVDGSVQQSPLGGYRKATVLSNHNQYQFPSSSRGHELQGNTAQPEAIRGNAADDTLERATPSPRQIGVKAKTQSKADDRTSTTTELPKDALESLKGIQQDLANLRTIADRMDVRGVPMKFAPKMKPEALWGYDGLSRDQEDQHDSVPATSLDGKRYAELGVNESVDVSEAKSDERQSSNAGVDELARNYPTPRSQPRRSIELSSRSPTKDRVERTERSEVTQQRLTSQSKQHGPLRQLRRARSATTAPDRVELDAPRSGGASTQKRGADSKLIRQQSIPKLLQGVRLRYEGKPAVPPEVMALGTRMHQPSSYDGWIDEPAPPPQVSLNSGSVLPSLLTGHQTQPESFPNAYDNTAESTASPSGHFDMPEMPGSGAAPNVKTGIESSRPSVVSELSSPESDSVASFPAHPARANSVRRTAAPSASQPPEAPRSTLTDTDSDDPPDAHLEDRTPVASSPARKWTKHSSRWKIVGCSIAVGVAFGASGIVRAANTIRDTYEFHQALQSRIDMFEASIAESHATVNKLEENYAVWSEYVRVLAEEDEANAVAHLETIHQEVEKWQRDMKADLAEFRRSLTHNGVDAVLEPLRKNATPS